MHTQAKQRGRKKGPESAPLNLEIGVEINRLLRERVSAERRSIRAVVEAALSAYLQKNFSP